MNLKYHLKKHNYPKDFGLPSVVFRFIKQASIDNLASPQMLAFVSCAIFLFAWLLPPGIYSAYIPEQDFVYLDPLSLIFYSACVLPFILGILTFKKLRQYHFRNTKKPMRVQWPLLFIAGPLTFSTGLCLVSIAVMGNVRQLISLLASGNGTLIKNAVIAGQVTTSAIVGNWGYVITLHIGVIWWALHRYYALKKTSRLFWWIFIVAVQIAFVSATIQADRTSLIPLISGIFIIYIQHKVSSGAKLSKLIGVTATMFLIIAGVFLALSYVRGAATLHLLLAGMLGYTGASYNRLAAELQGFLTYPFGGKGVYLSNFLAHNPTVNKIYNFERFFGGANSLTLWMSEFSAVQLAGLKAGLNWAGAFGYIYSDLGWFTPAYLYGIGIIYGWLWLSFKRGGPIAVILYPWFGFCILFWCGSNYLFDEKFMVLMLTACMLFAYEKVFVGTKESLETWQSLPRPSPFSF